MSFWVFSSESIPNMKLHTERGFVAGYTPEYISWAGITLPNIPEKEWMRIPDTFKREYRKDFAEKQRSPRHVEHIFTGEIVGKLNDRYEKRGVIFLDHQPTDEEKAELEAKSARMNRIWRMSVIEQYEADVREREVTGQGRKPTPTPYEDECYTLLAIAKPYSVDAILAQRQPGIAMGKQIVDAIEARLKERQAASAAAPATSEA